MSQRAPLPADFSALKTLQAWPPSAVDAALQQWWRGLSSPPACIAVAFSGGADSMALLLAVVRLCQSLADSKTDDTQAPQRILALHVHHGLQASADAFAAHCEASCAALQEAIGSAWTLEYKALPVQIELAKGDSVEAEAREVRYRALAQAAQAAGAEVVLLGQHADDQVESVLLALSRGAGVAGLAGMPAAFHRHGMAFARPLLPLEQHVLKDWLQTNRVPWVEDPTNTEQRYTRNRLRHAVLPVLEQHLPGFRTSMARSARLAAQADALLQELAAIDLEQTGNPPHIARLQQLSAERQANVLRHWLKATHGVIGSESQILALLQVLAACTTRGHRIHIKVGNGYVEREGDDLGWKLLQY
ncbi:MAG: tRNA lysidine(34) synthetase TilS [Brachymonas sp.]|nr:tRNA lysidine(34) synthetase TilS [Brachymonas sp.]